MSDTPEAGAVPGLMAELRASVDRAKAQARAERSADPLACETCGLGDVYTVHHDSTAKGYHPFEPLPSVSQTPGDGRGEERPDGTRSALFTPGRGDEVQIGGSIGNIVRVNDRAGTCEIAWWMPIGGPGFGEESSREVPLVGLHVRQQATTSRPAPVPVSPDGERRGPPYDAVVEWLADRDGEVIRTIESALLMASMDRGRGEKVSDQAEVVRVLRALQRLAAHRPMWTRRGDLVCSCGALERAARPALDAHIAAPTAPGDAS